MIGIIGAMEQEMLTLQSKLNNQVERTVGGFCFNAGTFEGTEVVLLQCGIGKTNSAIGCALLLEIYKPFFVINTGSAGGLLSSQTFGDIVISEAAMYHDVDVTAFGYESGQIPGLPTLFAADTRLVERAEASIDKLRATGNLPRELNHTRGVIGSGDVFVHNPDHVRSIQTNFPRLCAVEMEGASIAHTCHLFKTPFVILRALSDIAGKESPLKFDEFLPIASHHSSLVVLELVREISKENIWKK